MTAVWLVRHGETTAARGVAIGATDVGLSRHGEEQAAELAEQLASRPLKRVFASDLRRATQTARPIAARHDLEVEPVPALREIDFGAWEGRSLEGLWSEDSAFARAWEQDIRSTPPGFAESFADLESRTLGWWHAIRPTLGGEVVIVGHRGSLAVLWCAITGASIESAFARRLEVGEAISA